MKKKRIAAIHKLQVDDATDERIRAYAFKHNLPYLMAANHILNNRTLHDYGGAN